LGLKQAANDQGLQTTFWLLVQLTHAATKEQFHTALWKLGFSVPERPTLFDVTSTFSDYVQQHVIRKQTQTDISDISLSAAVETLTALCSKRTTDLFGVRPENVQKSIREYASKVGFSQLGHEFFSRFTNRYVSYLISRELPLHVGPDRRFKSTENLTEFNKALELHCRQASRIIEEFAGGWYSKSVWQGKLSQKDTTSFLHIALKKLRAELKRGEEKGG